MTRRCAKGLCAGGVIALKDNCTDNYTFVVDKDDHSVARSLEYHKTIFELAGLSVIAEVQQTDFPEELCPVMMFGLVPTDSL